MLAAIRARAWEAWRETGSSQLLVTPEELRAVGGADARSGWYLDSPHTELLIAEDWPTRRRPLLRPDTAEERTRRRTRFAEWFPSYVAPPQLEMFG